MKYIRLIILVVIFGPLVYYSCEEKYEKGSGPPEIQLIQFDQPEDIGEEFGRVEFSVSGGVPPYRVVESTIGNGVIIEVSGTQFKIDSLDPRKYIVMVYDSQWAGDSIHITMVAPPIKCTGLWDSDEDGTPEEYEYTFHNFGTELAPMIWMTENIRSTHYQQDGSAVAGDIELIDADGDGTGDITHAQYHLSQAFKVAHDTLRVPEGSQGLCPEKWHIPSMAEFDALLALWGVVPNASNPTNITFEPLGSVAHLNDPPWNADVMNITAGNQVEWWVTDTYGDDDWIYVFVIRPMASPQKYTYNAWGGSQWQTCYLRCVLD
jgi:uncharacterized protein (TIGR02145 family)